MEQLVEEVVSLLGPVWKDTGNPLGEVWKEYLCPTAEVGPEEGAQRLHYLHGQWKTLESPFKGFSGNAMIFHCRLFYKIRNQGIQPLDFHDYVRWRLDFLVYYGSRNYGLKELTAYLFLRVNKHSDIESTFPRTKGIMPKPKSGLTLKELWGWHIDQGYYGEEVKIHLTIHRPTTSGRIVVEEQSTKDVNIHSPA